jgi:deazaflavin-dependent oxidoreductase (nitroreductase family)
MADKTAKAPHPLLMKVMTRTHVFLHKLSGGRLFNSIMGDEVCFVTMTGAKSGRISTRPLMFVPHGNGLLLVASQGGAPKNPAWYYNLAKNPAIKVYYRQNPVMSLHARLASQEEKQALWPICYQHYAPYEEYRERTDRDIPIFVCEPLSADA